MIKQCVMTLVTASLISIGVPMASAQDGSASQQAAPTQSMPQDNAANGPDGGRGHRGPMDPAQRTAELTKKLNLTSDQQAKVQSLLEAQRSQMESARQDNSSAQQQDRRAKMMDIRKGIDTQIRAVLDSNQQKKWDDMQARREQWGQDHRGGGPRGQGGDQPGGDPAPPPSPQQ